MIVLVLKPLVEVKNSWLPGGNDSHCSTLETRTDSLVKSMSSCGNCERGTLVKGRIIELVTHEFGITQYDYFERYIDKLII